jgi:ABC-type sugar transport system ATPase subunit
MNRVTKFGMLNKKLEDSLARHYLEEVGIDFELYSKLPERLSEEKLVKIQIAKLLALKPLILILDEPTSEIDIISKKEICMLLKKIKKEMSIILITSEMEDMMELFDRMLVMNKGSIVAELTGVECNPKNIIRYFN